MFRYDIGHGNTKMYEKSPRHKNTSAWVHPVVYICSQILSACQSWLYMIFEKSLMKMSVRMDWLNLCTWLFCQLAYRTHDCCFFFYVYIKHLKVGVIYACINVTTSGEGNVH